MAEHNDLGKKGEKLAKEYLISEGYLLLYENWRLGRFEIDLIMQNDNNLIIVEVKTRNTEAFGSPESFVSKQQQLHLAEAVEGFFYKNPDINLEVRYDVVSVIIDGNISKVLHFEDAFWPDNLSSFSIDI